MNQKKSQIGLLYGRIELKKKKKNKKDICEKHAKCKPLFVSPEITFFKL